MKNFLRKIKMWITLATIAFNLICSIIFLAMGLAYGYEGKIIVLAAWLALSFLTGASGIIIKLSLNSERVN